MQSCNQLTKIHRSKHPEVFIVIQINFMLHSLCIKLNLHTFSLCLKYLSHYYLFRKWVKIWTSKIPIYDVYMYVWNFFWLGNLELFGEQSSWSYTAKAVSRCRLWLSPGAQWGRGDRTARGDEETPGSHCGGCLSQICWLFGSCSWKDIFFRKESARKQLGKTVKVSV